MKFTRTEDAGTLCSGLREAFDSFGGVPEHVLFGRCSGCRGPFSVDTYIPAFAGIARALGATPVEMQQTLWAYPLPVRSWRRRSNRVPNST